MSDRTESTPPQSIDPTESAETATPEPVPAGGAGADSGAAEVTGIEDADHADVANISSHNDIPGVGTRAADGSMESAQPADAGDARENGGENQESEHLAPTHHDDDDGEDAKNSRRALIQELQPGVDPKLIR